jgi:hypothetical protein
VWQQPGILRTVGEIEAAVFCEPVSEDGAAGGLGGFGLLEFCRLTGAPQWMQNFELARGC